ncbi:MULTISPECIES: PIG-L deacetylase family protein [Microbacterium]|jgi:N-acetylglucosamine malate deacetylase 1|uniref:PIG-L deacetylase family protein n=1 Tax=Microbacterium TaxID=33882 RepID=UPI001EF4C762|nr:PIG-L family deacetylase [Microbacterium sp. ACRRU]MCG7418560.1 PIG-L family deacetylase [Microbacterium sp. ACRRU]
MSKTVIAVGGHIGDMELTAGPTLAKVVLEGGRAIIVDCTYGERGHPTIAPSVYREQKLEEARFFADTIGAELVTLDYSDGFLPDDEAVAEQIAEVIREAKPDILITHWLHSMHRDHERAAQAAIRAAFLASIPIEEIDAERHSVPVILHAENWEDMEGFEADTFYEIPDEAYERWRAGIERHAFARGETYGFRFIDYYSALMQVKGCLVGHQRAAAFKSAGHERFALAGP